MRTFGKSHLNRVVMEISRTDSSARCRLILCAIHVSTSKLLPAVYFSRNYYNEDKLTIDNGFRGDYVAVQSID